MLRIRPFAALRPPPSLASRVASVPYDVVNTDEAREIAQRDSMSFMHVIRPEVDFAPGMDVYDDQVYDHGRHALSKLEREGALVQEETPCLYVYRQEAELGGRSVSQSGVVACCHIQDYNDNLIKKHEKTRKQKEDDRTRHVLTLRANAGPVFLLYQQEDAISQLVEAAQQQAPMYDFTADDGVKHTLWRLSDGDPLVKAFGEVPCAYVADGHHRSASAARAGAELAAANPNHTGDEEYNWFLCVLFASDQLNVLPYNRVVKDLNGHSAAELLAKLGEVATVTATNAPEPEDTGRFGMYLDGAWYRVELPADAIDRSDPVASLDYVLLYDRVLAPLLGIGDIRTDPRVDFVGGIRGTGALEKRVDSGECAVAFAMHAVTVQQLMQVADADKIMPPKSTWFEPKLRSGLLIHKLD